MNSESESTPDARDEAEEAVQEPGAASASGAAADSEQPAAEEQPEQPAAEEQPEAAAAQPAEPSAPEQQPAPAAEQPSEPAAEPSEPPAAETGGSEAEAESGTLAAPAAEAASADPSRVPGVDSASEQPESPAQPAASASEQPESPAQPASAQPAAAEEELPDVPRQRPEIPGADLIPDLVVEQEQFLDAEARAAAEAEAEARAARELEQAEEERGSEPIADAAIDLAAGARYSATGKRKSAVARVILKPGSGTYAINGKPLNDYFPRETLQRIIRHPLETVGYEERMDVVARMHGGGISAQAGALRHGIARALIVADPHLRGELKRRGFLTRDPRVKERKKAGLKKARKRPQFSKR